MYWKIFMKNDKNRANSSLYDISERITKLRKHKNLTQERLGELIGVSYSTISGYENDRTCPSPEVLIRLASILDTTTDELLGVVPMPDPTNPEDIINIEHLSKERKEIILALMKDWSK